MRYRLPIVLPLLIGVLFPFTGCHEDPQSPGGDLQEEAARQRAAWNRQGITDYTFVFERFCFCPQLAATVVVENDGIVSAEHLVSGQPLDPPLLASLRTVPQLFDFIDEMIAADPDTMTVTYDPALSYP
ncbi:MAG: hypothetical protein HKN12_04445, partial [Gemmatimonadetes bacterium]|nr:hypothetical protein [Gemmatimonadota bacterium]